MKLRRKKKLLKEIEENIPDFRTHEGKIVFKISEVIFLILFALLKGKNSFRKQHTWMEANRENRMLLKLFEKKEPLNIPSPSTLHHIAINIDNNALEKIFRDFFEKDWRQILPDIIVNDKKGVKKYKDLKSLSFVKEVLEVIE